VRTSYSVFTQTQTVQYSLLHTYAIWYSLLLLGYKPVQHVTVLNTAGNCNTVVRIIILYWNITGKPSYMWSVVDRNVVMRRIPIFKRVLKNNPINWFYVFQQQGNVLHFYDEQHNLCFLFHEVRYISYFHLFSVKIMKFPKPFNLLNDDLNPICHLLSQLAAQHSG